MRERASSGPNEVETKVVGLDIFSAQPAGSFDDKSIVCLQHEHSLQQRDWPLLIFQQRHIVPLSVQQKTPLNKSGWS